ncbi:hypothetical protein OB13_13660 [Pontibacter sp. HJ8]
MPNTFDKIKITYKDICSSKKRFLGNKYNGIGLDISVKPTKRVIIVEVSSKVLFEDCWKLISLGTVQRVYKSIAEQLDISFDEFVNGHVKNYLEVTNDVRVKQPHSTVGSMFDLSQLQTVYTRYGDKPHKSAGLPTSFNLIKDKLTYEYRDYFSCYVKLPELLALDKRENQRFLNAFTVEQREQVVKAFDRVVRIETKLQTLVKIRQHFNIPKGEIPTLWDILTSEVTLNRNMLDNIYAKVIESRKNRFKGSEKNMFLLHAYLEKHNYDLDKAFKYFKANVKYAKPNRFRDDLIEIINLQAQEKKDKLLEDYLELSGKL